jgi:dTMP kinase
MNLGSRGRFIVIEGLEGAGKSTAVQGLSDWLGKQGIPVVQTREPGGTRIGECLRSLIKIGLDEERLCVQSELLLMYAARTQLVDQVIRPALAAGQWVISDRFDLSSYAYQGGGRQIDLQMIDALSSFCLQGLVPDRLFFLNISPEQGLARVKSRGAPTDHIEQESLAFFRRVYQGYQERLALMPWAVQIDACLPPLSVVEEMIAKVGEFCDE